MQCSGHPDRWASGAVVHGVARRDRRAIAMASIAAQRLKVSALRTDEHVRVWWIEEDEVRAIDPDFARCTTSAHRRLCEGEHRRDSWIAAI
jgi:hypothetical protein